jgi:hypothetical protein
MVPGRYLTPGAAREFLFKRLQGAMHVVDKEDLRRILAVSVTEVVL